MNNITSFRVWDKTNKRMLTNTSFRIILVGDDLLAFAEYKPHIDGSYKLGKIQPQHPNNFEVMQYTGLHDKNGEEIYEGDVVIYPKPRHWSEKGNFVITYINGMFTAGFHNGSSTAKKPKVVSKYVEVIGNIYEHPNLLNQNN